MRETDATTKTRSSRRNTKKTRRLRLRVLLRDFVPSWSRQSVDHEIPRRARAAAGEITYRWSSTVPDASRMPSASTSAADRAAGKPVGEQRGALGRLLGHRREARRARGPDASAITPASRRANSSRTPATRASRPDRITSRASRRRHGECRHGLHRALDVRLPGEAAARACSEPRAPRPTRRARRRSSRRRRRTAGASMTEPARNATSPSSAPAARTPSGPDVPPAPSTIAAVLDGDRRRERAAQLEQDERDVPLAAPAPLGLLAHGERGGAHLVRGAHVDAVHLPVRRHRREVHDARREHDRHRGAREHPHQRAEPADAAGLAVGGEVRQPEVGRP